MDGYFTFQMINNHLSYFTVANLVIEVLSNKSSFYCIAVYWVET